MTGIMTIIGLISATSTHKRDIKMGITTKQSWIGAQFWVSPVKVQKNAKGHCTDWRQKAIVSNNYFKPF